MSATEQQRDELVERLFGAGLGMAEILTVYLGDTLGLYRALQGKGAMTAPELAEEAGILPRYAREWLEQQAAAGFVTVDDPSAEPDARRYGCPKDTRNRSSIPRARIGSRRSASRSSRQPA
jgi:hypothetical protein